MNLKGPVPHGAGPFLTLSASLQGQEQGDRSVVEGAHDESTDLLLLARSFQFELVTRKQDSAFFQPPPNCCGPWPKSTVNCHQVFRGYHQ